MIIRMPQVSIIGNAEVSAQHVNAVLTSRGPVTGEVCHGGYTCPLLYGGVPIADLASGSVVPLAQHAVRIFDIRLRSASPRGERKDNDAAKNRGRTHG
jgi:hypothetical protein